MYSSPTWGGGNSQRSTLSLTIKCGCRRIEIHWKVVMEQQNKQTWWTSWTQHTYSLHSFTCKSATQADYNFQIPSGSLLLLCWCLRLEPDLLRFSVSLWARAGGAGPAHRPTAPHPGLHLHRGHRLRGRCRHVVCRLCHALCCLRLQLQHLQEHPQASGERSRLDWLHRFVSARGLGLKELSSVQFIYFKWYLQNNFYIFFLHHIYNYIHIQAMS